MAASSPKLSRNPPSPPLVLFLSPPKAAKPFFPQKQNLQLPLLHCSCQPSKNISPTTAPPTTTTLQQLLKSPSPSSWQSSKYLITAWRITFPGVTTWFTLQIHYLILQQPVKRLHLAKFATTIISQSEGLQICPYSVEITSARNMNTEVKSKCE